MDTMTICLSEWPSGVAHTSFVVLLSTVFNLLRFCFFRAADAGSPGISSENLTNNLLLYAVIWGCVLYLMVFWGTLYSVKYLFFDTWWYFMVMYGKVWWTRAVLQGLLVFGVVQYTWWTSVICLGTLAWFTLLVVFFCCTSSSSEVLNERIYHFTLCNFIKLHSILSLWLLNVVNEYFLVLRD